MKWPLFFRPCPTPWVHHCFTCLSLVYLACCSITTAYVTRETACWTSGGVCTVCTECVSLSFCRPQPRCTYQTTCGPSTASASPGPPTELLHPASDRATPLPTGPPYGCTSCAIRPSPGATCDQRSTIWGSPVLLPGIFSLPQLPSEVLLWSSDILVCRNTGREKDMIQVWFLSSDVLVTVGGADCNQRDELQCSFLIPFFCLFKKKKKPRKNPSQPPCP